jgi:hypothetical protein
MRETRKVCDEIFDDSDDEIRRVSGQNSAGCTSSLRFAGFSMSWRKRYKAVERIVDEAA